MPDDASPRRFVGEAISPVDGTMTLGGLARGEPGLPGKFRWRGREYEMAGIVRSWKDYRPEGHVAGGERYLRKHWYTIVTTTGERMTIYCDRAARSRSKPVRRWWLHTVEPGETSP